MTADRDWAGRKITNEPIACINNTAQDVRRYHSVIMAAIEAGGVFNEDFADIFALTRPAGVWVLNFA